MSNTLTVQEIEAAFLAHYDLGPGYPQSKVPTYIRDLYLDDGIEELSLKFPPEWTPEKQLHVEHSLTDNLFRFLDVRDEQRSQLIARTTFSGSTALDRAIAASDRLRRRLRRRRTVVITTSPSIDIMRLFLEERGLTPFFVESGLAGGSEMALNVDKLVEVVQHVQQRYQNPLIVLLLSSPENPTGMCWSAKELERLSELTCSVDGMLIVDHTFLVAGVQEHRIPRVWENSIEGCRWLAVWDTGKTFGLNEDKLGFVLCQNAEMQACLDEAVSVLQFGVARRQKLFFGRLFELALYNDHVGQLRADCRRNVDLLQHQLLDTGLLVNPPEAGSLALVDLSGVGRNDEEVRQRLLRSGVGVVSANVFFHGKRHPDHLIRIALARAPDYFAQAMLVFCRELGLR